MRHNERPDRRPHSITRTKGQKLLAKRAATTEVSSDTIPSGRSAASDDRARRTRTAGRRPSAPSSRGGRRRSRRSRWQSARHGQVRWPRQLRNSSGTEPLLTRSLAEANEATVASSLPLRTSAVERQDQDIARGHLDPAAGMGLTGRPGCLARRRRSEPIRQRHFRHLRRARRVNEP